ncbi:response regulator transcription factor [Belnapia sp. T6]|uniref:Response regulator transcription factor n=1 Tax=Belnapia mucosa TaxID=2804532 RepID=A0ABS1VEK8_9PROT|nr:response regulator transcription factor [Belnapia mucosa]MBL6459154.1 response regulator transcription factor [Belnapia mucosa]
MDLLRKGTLDVVRILLADDHDIVRHGLRQLLEHEPGWEVCGEARDGRTAVEMAEALAPDVAVLDVAMPELNGLEATRRIRAARPATEVLVFTMHESEELVAEVFAAGARGYLVKSDAPHHIIAAIEALAAHQPFFSARVTARLLEAFLRDRAASAGEDTAHSALTAREREVAQLLAEGRRSKDIARRLGVSVKTVETHRAAVMRKVGAGSIADVVRYAVRNHIISA